MEIKCQEEVKFCEAAPISLLKYKCIEELLQSRLRVSTLCLKHCSARAQVMALISVGFAMLSSFVTSYGWKSIGATSALRLSATNRQSSLALFSTIPDDRTELNVKTAESVNYDNFNFELVKQSTGSRARLGTVTTPHGVIHTPNFVFCGSLAGK